jgi:hypothetical protein
MRRITALAALTLLAACASPWVPNEPLPPTTRAPPPPVIQQQQAPTPAPQPPPQAQPQPPAASGVTVAPAPRRAPPSGDIVVPGQVERQVPTPEDPRSDAQRMSDIRSWDQCVMRVQGNAEGDPMRPQLDTPEDVCRRSLGMSSRLAVPDSRRP